MSEHSCPVMTSLLLPTVAVALTLALETPQDCDEVMKAAALRKDALLSEAKHGRHDAPSAAAVAQDVEPWQCTAHDPDLDPWGRQCSLPGGHTGEHCAQDEDGNVLAHWPPASAGHLPQHTHSQRGCTQPGCTQPGCHDAGHELPAPTAEASADRLAAHAPRGAL